MDQTSSVPRVVDLDRFYCIQLSWMPDLAILCRLLISARLPVCLPYLFIVRFASVILQVDVANESDVVDLVKTDSAAAGYPLEPDFILMATWYKVKRFKSPDGSVSKHTHTYAHTHIHNERANTRALRTFMPLGYFAGN